ncbi:MAG: hypothetical protein J2P14_09325 [Acidothermales bacterium]|nr:hypothetical protein [Acidothermales bacterium]
MPADKDRLRWLWQRASRLRGWRVPGDWWAPPVEAVVDAVVAGGPLAEPFARLGAAREEAGVGLPEAFDDVWSLFSVLGRIPPAVVVRRFAESYARSGSTAGEYTESVEPLSGLARPDYLRTRLGEVYAEAAAAGTDPNDRYGLVGVRVDEVPSGWDGVARRLSLARVLTTAFSAGETVADLGPAAVAVLTIHRVSVLPADLPRTLRLATETDVSVRPLRLPATLPAALTLLDVLAAA